MESFAEYILSEEKLDAKMEIAYYLAKKKSIFFDKSVIFKTEIVRMFLKYLNIEIDENLVLTASLLCNCKKIDNAQNIEAIHGFAKKGAELLETIGFDKRFCKICQEINRYENTGAREKESDILELVDQFGGMLLDRPERIGLKADEALVLLEHRNLKNKYNRYLNSFMEFVEFMDEIKMGDDIKIPALSKLIKIYYESNNVADFIKKVAYEYETNVNELMDKRFEIIENRDLNDNPNRPLFSEETTNKIMNQMEEKAERIKNNV